MNDKIVEKWFEQEAEKSGLAKGYASKTPIYQKLLTYTLVLGIPVTFSGCSDQPTAKDDCLWEKEHGHPEINCDNTSTSGSGGSSSWYRSRGYKSSSDPIHTNSPNYSSIHSAGGIGSGAKSTGGFFSGS